MKTITTNKSEKQLAKTFKDFSKSPVIQKKVERANAIISQLENIKI
jgi:ABC-type thiamine transport system substrate-binding protein